MSATTARFCGALIAIGALLWAATRLVIGVPAEGVNHPVEIWGSFAFQLGVLAFLAVAWATKATGSGRGGRAVLAIELILLTAAIGWTIPHLWQANRPHDELWIQVLDAGWPFSMLGLIAVGAAIARARRWPGAARWLPLAASLLIVVDIALVWLPLEVSHVITFVYLAVAYTLLGVAVIRDVAPLLADGTQPREAAPAGGVGSTEIRASGR
jgi:hypothetical protein